MLFYENLKKIIKKENEQHLNKKNMARKKSINENNFKTMEYNCKKHYL